MKYKTTVKLKEISHLILFTISTVLTCNLLVQLTNSIWFKVIWVLFGISIEIIKIYLFLHVKQSFKRGGKDIWLSAILFVVYTGLAIVSLIASLGFILTNLENQSFVSSSRNRVITNNEIYIEEINNEILSKIESIDMYTNRIADLPSNYVTASERYNTLINELQSDIVELKNQRNDLVSTQSDVDVLEVVSKDIFSLIGSKIKIGNNETLSGSDTMFYLMLLLIFLLELCLVITCGNIEEGKILIDNKLLVKYIDHLFDKGKIISDEEISNKINLNILQCKKFRKHLQLIKYKDIPLLDKSGILSNYTYKDIKSIINFKLNFKDTT